MKKIATNISGDRLITWIEKLYIGNINIALGAKEYAITQRLSYRAQVSINKKENYNIEE